jgi:hypothetical protein
VEALVRTHLLTQWAQQQVQDNFTQEITTTLAAVVVKVKILAVLLESAVAVKVAQVSHHSTQMQEQQILAAAQVQVQMLHHHTVEPTAVQE